MTIKNKKYSNVPLEVELKLKKILLQDKDNEVSEELKEAKKKALERAKGKLTTEEMLSRGLIK